MPTSKRPCRICRRWFEPDPRVGQRHRVCGRDECQHERHRRNCARGNAADRKQERDDLLKKGLVVVGTPSVATGGTEVPGSGSQDLVISKTTVPVGKFLKVLGLPP